jgi:HSP20 family molecular chaperone IbpA
MAHERREPAGGKRGMLVSEKHEVYWEVRGVAAAPSAEEVARRFEELLRGRWSSHAAPPLADVFVAAGELWVEMDLPGVGEDEVRVSLEHGFLFIEAQRRLSPPAAGARPARLERPRGPLRRRIALPEVPADPQLEVHLEDGVLRVHVTSRRGP